MGVTAAVVGAVAAVGGVAQSMDASRKATHAREDAERAAKLVETNAAQTANSRLAMRRRALAKNSLITGESDIATTGIAGGGRATMGGA